MKSWGQGQRLNVPSKRQFFPPSNSPWFSSPQPRVLTRKVWARHELLQTLWIEAQYIICSDQFRSECAKASFSLFLILLDFLSPAPSIIRKSLGQARAAPDIRVMWQLLSGQSGERGPIPDRPARQTQPMRGRLLPGPGHRLVLARYQVCGRGNMFYTSPGFVDFVDFNLGFTASWPLWILTLCWCSVALKSLLVINLNPLFTVFGRSKQRVKCLL